MKITTTDKEVQRMLDDMEIKVQMTPEMIREFYAIQMSKSTDIHLAALVDEIQGHGSEVTDMIVNQMIRYTDIGYVSIRGELDLVVLQEVAKRWREKQS